MSSIETMQSDQPGSVPSADAIPDHLNRPMSEGGIVYVPPAKPNLTPFVLLLVAVTIPLVLIAFAMGVSLVLVFGVIPLCVVVITIAALKFLLGG